MDAERCRPEESAVVVAVLVRAAMMSTAGK